jgi:hypothetical protein
MKNRFEIIDIPDDVNLIQNQVGFGDIPLIDQKDPSTFRQGDMGMDEYGSYYMWDQKEQRWRYTSSKIGWRSLIHRGFERRKDGNFYHPEFPLVVTIRETTYGLGVQVFNSIMVILEVRSATDIDQIYECIVI